MTEIDYKAVVLNVYPDAFCTHIDYGWGIFKDQDDYDKWQGIGNSKYEGCTKEKAWKSAYERLNKTT